MKIANHWQSPRAGIALRVDQDLRIDLERRSWIDRDIVGGLQDNRVGVTAQQTADLTIVRGSSEPQQPIPLRP